MTKLRPRWLLLALALYAAIGVVALRDFTFTGAEVAGIPWWSGDVEVFYRTFLAKSAWVNQLSRAQSPAVYLGHLPYVPFLAMARLWNGDSWRVVSWMWVALFSVAGASAFYLVWISISIAGQLLDREKVLIVVAFLSGLYYMCWPFFGIGSLTEPSELWAYACFPFVIALLIRAFHRAPYTRTIIMAALVTAWVTFMTNRFLISVVLVLVSYAVLYIIFGRPRVIRIKRSARVVGLFAIAFFLLGGFNLWQFAASVRESATVPLVNPESYLVPWRLASPINLLYGFGWFLLPEQYDWGTALLPMRVHLALAGVIPALSLIALLVRRKCFLIVMFFGLMLSLTLVFFSNEDLVRRLVTQSPGSFYVGRMFRTPRIPSQLVAVSLTVLFGLALQNSTSALSKFTSRRVRTFVFIILILCVLICIIMTSWPFFATGRISRYTAKISPSIEYKNTVAFLRSIAPGRVLIFPDVAPCWYGLSRPRFYTYNSPLPTLCVENNRWVHFFYYVLNSRNALLRRRRVSEIVSLLRRISVRYLVLHAEGTWPRDDIEALVRAFSNCGQCKVIYSNEAYWVIEIAETEQAVYAFDSLAVVEGGLATTAAFDQLGLPASRYAVVQLDDTLSPETVMQASCMVFSSSANEMDVAVQLMKGANVYVPTRHAGGGVMYLTDPHHGVWHDYVQMLGDHKWQFSYGPDCGFVRLSDPLHIPLQVERGEVYYLFVRLLKSPKGGKVLVTLEDKSRVIDTTSSGGAIFVWEQAGVVHATRPQMDLTISSIKGENVVNLIVLIPSGEWKEVQETVHHALCEKAVVYVPGENGEVEYSTNGSATIPLHVLSEGWYRVALRQGIGVGKLLFENRQISMVPNKDSWIYSEAVHIKEGDYRLIIEGAFENLVRDPSFESADNSWSVPKNGYYIRYDEKTTTEGRMSLRVATKSTAPGWSWVSQEVLVKPGVAYRIETSMKWHNVMQSHVAIDGYSDLRGWFRLCTLPGRARDGSSDWERFNTTITIPEDVQKIRVSLNSGWVRNPALGEAVTWFDRILIVEEEEIKDCDEIVLFRIAHSDQTLVDILQPSGTLAKVENVQRIAQNEYKAVVQASRPFVLALAESYDPQWIARVETSTGVKWFSATPLYGVINGFVIDAVGECEIKLMYKPERRFDCQVTATVCASLAVLVGLALFWGMDTLSQQRWRRKTRSDRLSGLYN